MISDFVNKTVCFILDKRIENKPYIEEVSKKLGLNVEFFVMGDGSQDLSYDYIDDPELKPHKHSLSTNYPSWWKGPAYNFWKCQKKVIEQKQREGTNTLLLLEDDIQVEDDFEEIWSKSESFFRQNEWDMVYLGGYSIGHWKNIGHEHIHRNLGGGGMHAVILHHEIFTPVLNLSPLGPLDWTIGKYIHPNYRCFAIHPSIVTQKPGFSFIEGNHLGEKPSRYKI